MGAGDTEKAGIEQAIARVLEAEQAARASVESAHREAEAIREAARSRDRRIAERAAARIAAVRAGMARKRESCLAGIEAEAVALDPRATLDAVARGRLPGAVAQLADELIAAEVVRG